MTKNESLTLAARKLFERNCPIREFTADRVPVGRCWYFLFDGHTCPRHGDVSTPVARYKATYELTNEYQDGVWWKRLAK